VGLRIQQFFTVLNKINLANKPFTNRSLPWIAASIILLGSLIALVLLVRSSSRANAQTAALQTEIRSLRQEESGLEQQANSVKQSLTPEQFQTLRATHELVDRKKFSWSRLFGDLEGALPGDVRVTRISVKDVAARGEQTVAELDLTIVAKSSTTITSMISDMDRTGVFQANLRAQNLQKGRGETGTEYELTVIYRPRMGVPTSESPAPSLARVEDGQAGKGETR
jgi:Tfp pilus assembly protein PilN